MRKNYELLLHQERNRCVFSAVFFFILDAITGFIKNHKIYANDTVLMADKETVDKVIKERME